MYEFDFNKPATMEDIEYVHNQLLNIYGALDGAVAFVELQTVYLPAIAKVLNSVGTNDELSQFDDPIVTKAQEVAGAFRTLGWFFQKLVGEI